MRKALLIGVCAMVFSSAAHAQVEVNDAGSILEEVAQYLQQGKAYLVQAQQYVQQQLSWTKQVAQYVLQVQQYATEAAQLLAFVHNPSLGTVMPLLNAAGLGSSMPINSYALQGIINGVEYGNGGLPEIQGILGSMSQLSVGAYTANHVYSPNDGSWTSQQIIANANSIAGTQGTSLAAYSDLKTHAAALPAMRDHLATATTPKDVQDAQAQIELETTWTANESAQMLAAQTTYQAQQAAQQQKVSEEVTKSLDGQISQARAAGIIP
jgi:hypothetical protein